MSDPILLGLRAMAFFLAVIGTWAGSRWLLRHALLSRLSLRRAREPHLAVLIDMHCEHDVTWWCETHGPWRCLGCGYCWGNCGHCAVYVKGTSEIEAGS